MGKKKRGEGGHQALLDHAEATVRKRYKSALLGRASEELVLPSVFVSSNSLALDLICSAHLPGGLPIGPRSGRVVHVPGDWSTGKTLLLDHWFKSVVVELKGLAYCSESEGSKDPHFPNAIGLPLEKVTLDRPATLEEAVDHFLEWHDDIRSKDPEIPILAGLDSLDSSEAERAAKQGLSEGGGWRYGGGKSEALGAGLRKIVQRSARYPTTYVILNQVRQNVGAMPGMPQKRSSGGEPPHFYASLEIWLSGSPLGKVEGVYRGTPLSKEMRKRLGFGPKDHGELVGRWVRAKVTKTKIAKTMNRTGDFYIDFARGVHRWGGLIQEMIKEGRVLVKEDGSVEHQVGDTKHPFPSIPEWTTWISGNEEALHG